MIKAQNRSIVKLAATILVVYLIVFGLYTLRDFFIPMIFSGILSFLLVPVVAFLERKKVPRILAIVITLIIAILLIVLLFTLVIAQISTFDEVIPAISSKIEVWFRNLQSFASTSLNLEMSDVLEEGKKYVSSFVQNGSKLISGTLSVTTSFLTTFSLIPLYVFLMLFYRDFFLAFLFKAFKSVSNHRVKVVVDKIKNVVQSYMSGLLLVILIVGTLNTISLLILGIDHAVFFGFFAAVLVLVPYIGVAVGSILPILMALITKDSGWYAVGVAASFGVIQFLEGNFITPYIVGGKISLNAFIAIISLLLFGSLWGISGLILALPLTAILKVLFDSVESLKPYGFLIGEADQVVKKKFIKPADKTA